MNSKGIGTEGRRRLAKVISAAKGVITPVIAAKALGVSRQEAGRLLSRWQNSGWLKRVKRGVYVPVPLEDADSEHAIEEPWLVVSKVYGPGYVGGFSAVKHWDLSEQIFETVTFLTTKVVPERSPTIGGIKVKLKTISEKKNFATKTVWIDNVKVLVSDPTKTMADFLDDPSLAGGMRVVRDVFDEYMNSEYKDLPKLVSYAEKMGNRTILKRLGFLLETMGLSSEVEPLELKDRLSKGNSDFDPLVENDVIVNRWSLRVPRVWKKEYDRER